MGRNLVPRANKDADLGTQEKNWNKLYVDAITLRNSDLRSSLDGKVDRSILTNKGDLFVATGARVITRLPKGPDGHILKANSTDPNGVSWELGGKRQELTSNLEIAVGSGGDFPTINAALAHVVSTYYPINLSTAMVPRVTIQLLSGFVMAEQVLVESLDLSWITITGVDAETVINRSALTRVFGQGYPAFAAINGGFLPIIGQLFNMNTSGTASDRHGILAFSNSRAIVLDGCGVKNAGTNGIVAYHSSTINAYSANASGAGIHGIFAAHGSLINAEGADASGAGTYGIYATHGSLINADGANASGAGTYGICAYHGSLINAYGATGTLNQAKNTLTVDGIIFQ